MANTLSAELLAQIFAQNSDDPFLTLVTLSHATFAEDITLVNNSKNVISRGIEFLAFPMKIRFPVDDGESTRDFTIDFDNASLELLVEIRSVTDKIGIKIEMILASMPDVVQMVQEDLFIGSVSYNAQRITCKVVMDNFLNVELTSERYGPNNFPGLF